MKLQHVLLTLTCILSLDVCAQKPLTLDECRTQAVENNTRVKIADQRVRSAESFANATVKDLYPTISASGGYKYLADPMSIDLDGDIFIGTQHLYDINMMLTQNIYSGNKVQLTSENAQFQEKIAGGNLELTTNELLFQTDIKYWNASWSREANNLAIQYKDLLDQLVIVVTDKVETGLVPRNDLLMTQVKQNQAELMIFKTRTQHQVALMELNWVMGNDVNQDISVMSSNLYQDYSLPALENFDQVLSQRPEVSIQKDKISISENNIGLAKSSYLPQISLNFMPVWGAPNTDLLNPEPIFNAAAFASVTMPLIQWGKKQSEVGEKKYDYEASLLEMEDIQNQISLEVSSAYYRLQSSIENIQLSEASLGNATENRDLIEARYLEGLSPITDLLDAQFNWLQASNAVLDARLSYFAALAEYRYVIGQN